MLPRPRPAVPADAPSCLPLIAAAGGALLSWSLGPDSDGLRDGLLARCWSLDGHPLGPRNTTVIDVDGRVVALLVGDTVTSWTRAERRRPVPLQGLAPSHTLVAVQTRLDAQRRIRPALPEDAWYLSSLSVDPAYRRRGLARMLLAEACTRARATRCPRVLVEVERDNAPAVSLYRSAGFEESGHWQPEDGPDMLRLLRAV